MKTLADCDEDLMLYAKTWEEERPLPTTRALAGKLGVSHVTISKSLKRLADRRILWRDDSGRYFASQAAARRTSSKPVGCLIRSFSAWSSWYRHILAGVGRACEVSGRGLLFHPTHSLVRQTSPESQPKFPSRDRQRAAIEAFLQDHQRSCACVLLDEIWSDDVLAEMAPRIPQPRMLMRPTPIDGIASFRPDYDQGALLALSHVATRGFDKFWIVRPFKGSAPVDGMVASCRRAVSQLGWEDRFQVVELDGKRGFEPLLEQLLATDQRVGLFCPEDNFGLAIHRRLTESGIAIPDRVGLIAGLGTEIVVDAGLTSLDFDFERLGAAAASTAPTLDNPTSGFTFDLNFGLST